MATKTVVAAITLVTHCPKKSVAKRDEAKKVIAGEFERVEMLSVAPGDSLTLDSDEADILIARGFARLPGETKLDAKTVKIDVAA